MQLEKIFKNFIFLYIVIFYDKKNQIIELKSEN